MGGLDRLDLNLNAMEISDPSGGAGLFHKTGTWVEVAPAVGSDRCKIIGLGGCIRLGRLCG